MFSAICNSFQQCYFKKYAALYDPKCFCNENGGGMYDDGICCNTKPRCFVPNDGNEEIVDATTTHVFNANEEECAYPYHGIATHRYDTQTQKFIGSWTNYQFIHEHGSNCSWMNSTTTPWSYQSIIHINLPHLMIHAIFDI